MMTWDTLLDEARLFAVGAGLARIAAIAILAWIVLRISARLVERIRENWLRASSAASRQRFASPAGNVATRAEELEKRSRTIARLLLHALSVLVILVSVLIIADQAGFELRALLGAVGVVSLAIGFGARSLVQDLITGIFLLVEDQIREGDVVRLGRDVSGQVEQITLRHVRIRSGDGTVHIVPNGKISTVSNLTHQFSYYLWDLKLSYHADIDGVATVLSELGRELREDPDVRNDTLDDLEILGVDGFHAHGPVLKLRVKTVPKRQWAVGRAFNRRIKQRFDEAGIPFPHPTRRLYPADPALRADLGRSQLKQQVRTLLSSGVSELS